MKAKVLNSGCYGESLELEGTPEEIAAFLKARKTEPTATPPVFVPSFYILDVCPQGGAHEYPQAWWSVSPPACQKCGQVSAAPPPYEMSLRYTTIVPMRLSNTTIVLSG
jgi:hypothetical protein